MGRGAGGFGRAGLAGVLPLMLAGLAGCHHAGSGRVYPPAASSAPGYPPVSGGASVGTGRVEIGAGSRLISTEVGLASWYGTVYDRRPGANGEIFDKDGMTAASRTLPLGVLARVTNVATGQVAVVRITDRGPFVPGRIIDLSEGVAKGIGLYRAGVGQVKVEGYEPEGYAEVPARWCVQIGAFLDPDDAVQLKNDMKRRYGTAKVITFKGPTGSWVRVTLAEPGFTGSTAAAAAVRVPDPGVGAYVTRTN